MIKKILYRIFINHWKSKTQLETNNNHNQGINENVRQITQ